MDAPGSASALRRVATVALALAILALPGTAAAAAQTTYQVTFDSTMVNQFAGMNNEPSGAETTEVVATIDLSPQSGGAYSGSAMSTYKQASGTISESCQSGSTTGTTTETELSGTPTKFTATYAPGSGTSGGILVLDLGPFIGGLEESFQDVPGCGGFTVGNTTPRFLADFVKDHQSQFSPSLTGDAAFRFSLLPGGSLGGSTSYAGTYAYSGGFTNNNLTANETTDISVFKQTSGGSSGGGGSPVCKVPNVKGDTLAAAKAKIRRANCSVGKITRKKSARRHRGRVLSESPRSGSSKTAGTKIALTVGK
jgi:PASTA domain